MDIPYAGGCLCGKIRYECALPPEISYYCHCSDCRKANGSAYHVGLYLPLSGFEITAGKPKGYDVVAESGRVLTRHFCGDCGTPIHITKTGGDKMVSLKAGTLDDPAQVAPTVEIWARSKVSWADIPKDIKSHERGIQDG